MSPFGSATRPSPHGSATCSGTPAPTRSCSAPSSGGALRSGWARAPGGPDDRVAAPGRRRPRALRGRLPVRRVRGAGQGPDPVPDVQRARRGACARADAAGRRRPSRHAARRLPRSVHHAPILHDADARSGLRRAGGRRERLGADHFQRRRPARRSALARELQHASRPPRPQLGHAARQVPARGAALPERSPRARGRRLRSLQCGRRSRVQDGARPSGRARVERHLPELSMR